MHSKPTSTTPHENGDGTLSALLVNRFRCDPYGLILHVALPPALDAAPVAGRFFMLRCVDDTPLARRTDWSTYPRRPLFVAGSPVPHTASGGLRWDLFAPADHPHAVAWLESRPVGSQLNLTGPFGLGHALPGHSRTLLALAEPGTLPLLLPWLHAMLDQGGRVSLVLSACEDVPRSLLPWLPIPVEVHPAPSPEDLSRHLTTSLRWADHCVIALPPAQLPLAAALIRQQRFRLEPGFALAFVRSDLVCGFGACLACTVPKVEGGHTRACLHGPFLPLEELAR